MRPWGVGLDIDDEAEAFCRALYPKLSGVLALHAGDAGVGEELAQEALLRAWERWTSVRTMDSPEGWVFRVGFNLATSRFRRKQAEWRANERHTRRSVADAGPIGEDLLAVRSAVAELPARQRAVLLLRYFADLSVDDTAAALGCPPGTVKSLTSRAVDGLRARIDLDDEEHVDA